ncbi:unnamed protein product [marine sediment metagenome]|uniref:Uncharacterized protein n=1 Tax=marine sediment metagenome TaxID=412755 RepID=X1G3J3_9ZZZZ
MLILYLKNVHYSNSTFSQVLLFRIKSLRKFYLINLNDRDIDTIANKFIQKFGTNYLYFSQIESPLTQFLKPYALHTIRNIRNMIRPYVKELRV